MSCEKKTIASRETEDEDIWSAIQYLDPDLNVEGSNAAVTVAMLFAVLLVCTILLVLKVRGL